jgi:hypothetical protein
MALMRVLHGMTKCVWSGKVCFMGFIGRINGGVRKNGLHKIAKDMLNEKKHCFNGL